MGKKGTTCYAKFSLPVLVRRAFTDKSPSVVSEFYTEDLVCLETPLMGLVGGYEDISTTYL